MNGNQLRAVIELEKMSKEPKILNLESRKAIINSSIYACFITFGCKAGNVKLDNGIDIKFYEYCGTNNGFVRFKIKADKAVLVEGSIEELYKDPVFVYKTESMQYSKNNTILELDAKYAAL